MKGVVYVETSAVLRILLEGDRPLSSRLARTRKLVTSALTRLEALRGLSRAVAEDRITPQQEREGQRWLRDFLGSCDLVLLADEILVGAGQRFPIEPVRTLDALHLASALLCEEGIGSTTMVSCDDRVRDNARALGLKLLPS